MIGARHVGLETEYLGLHLRSPLVASASPISRVVDGSRALADAGVAAIVLPSLFEEEVIAEEVGLTLALEAGSEHFAEATSYFPGIDDFSSTADRYLTLIEKTKGAVTVPVIASLNASFPGGWVRYALEIAGAGADALELNVYRVPTDPRLSSSEVEASDLELVREVCAEVSIPVAVKLSPYYSSLAGFAAGVVRAGARGLVLFNRFYQPDLDLETLDVVPRVELSHRGELRLPFRWIAILRPQLGPQVALAASSGVHAGGDVVKAIAVGADVAMMTSALLRHGPGHVAVVEAELRTWLAEHEYTSVEELRGSVSHVTSGEASAFERANYLKALHSWTGHELDPTGR